MRSFKIPMCMYRMLVFSLLIKSRRVLRRSNKGNDNLILALQQLLLLLLNLGLLLLLEFGRLRRTDVTWIFIVAPWVLMISARHQQHFKRYKRLPQDLLLRDIVLLTVANK